MTIFHIRSVNKTRIIQYSIHVFTHTQARTHARTHAHTHLNNI